MRLGQFTKHGRTGGFILSVRLVFASNPQLFGNTEQLTNSGSGRLACRHLTRMRVWGNIVQVALCEKRHTAVQSVRPQSCLLWTFDFLLPLSVDLLLHREKNYM